MWAKKFKSDGDRIPAEFTFRLERGTEIGGVVRNERGEPIKGVKVEVQYMTEGRLGLPSRPGKRPEGSRWLALREEVVTDAKGCWRLNNVPSKKSLADPKHGGDRIPSPPKIAIRLRHPDYANEKEWGKLQQEQGVTLKSLRNQTAVIVMKGL